MIDPEWNDEYLLGIPAIDLQHRRIFDCLVIMAREEPARQNRVHADFWIARLAGLLQEHFALEESMMRALGYPGLERHIEEHRQFHADVHGLGQGSLESRGSVPHKMMELLQWWQREHIMMSDRHYVEYFSGPMGDDGGNPADPK